MKISVIIPVKNGAQTIEDCLDSIRNQTIKDIEIIILDSMSDDNTREIALRFNVKIIDIPEGTFNHGLTRNLGAMKASGKFLFYTVQDARLSENDMMEKMVQHFDDEEVMGVVGHQAIPWGEKDKNPAYWFKRYTEPEIYERHFPDNSFSRLSKNEQFSLSGWDDVVAMYRRSSLMDTPFRETNFSEDWLWASDALNEGYKLLSDPSIVVYHYHHLTFNYRFKTQFTVNYHFYKFFDQLPAIPFSPMRFLRATNTILKRSSVPVFKKLYWVVHNLGINLADFCSNTIFRSLLMIGGDKLLNKGHRLFCNQIPQGAIKRGKREFEN